MTQEDHVFLCSDLDNFLFLKAAVNTLNFGNAHEGVGIAFFNNVDYIVHIITVDHGD